MFVTTNLLLPTDGVDPSVLGDQPTLLCLRVQNAHQPRLLSQRVPSEAYVDAHRCLIMKITHFCESILAAERKLKLGMLESP